MEGFKDFKDRIMFLFGGNATGYRPKHCLVWQGENPMALEHASKHTLPLYHRSNEKSWVIQLLFQDALLNGCPAKWRSTVWRITYLSRSCLLLIISPDILLLLVIFIPISKWCLSFQTQPLCFNQWIKES